MKVKFFLRFSCGDHVIRVQPLDAITIDQSAPACGGRVLVQIYGTTLRSEGLYYRLLLLLLVIFMVAYFNGTPPRPPAAGLTQDTFTNPAGAVRALCVCQFDKFKLSL